MKPLFIISYLVFFIGLSVFKKTKRKINIIIYLIVQIMLVMILNATLMSILYIFGVGTTPLFTSSILGITGIILIVIAIKQKSIQQYTFKWTDLIASIAIVITALAVGITLFGTDLHLAYNNADPAAHFYMVQNNLIHGGHSGMFFNEVNNALIINGLSIFTSSTFANYKLYLIIEVGMLALSGLMFYASISNFAKKPSQRILCMMIPILYMLGYSLNNTIFGFGYLGTATTLICFIIIICKAFWDKKISISLFIPLAAMSMLSIALCYMLFAPAVWGLVAIILYTYCRKNKLNLKKTILIELGVFLIPLVLAIKFCYFDFFLVNDSNIGDQLRAQGGAYYNYFTNFIIFAPAIVFSVIRNIKNRQSFVITFFMLGWLAFVTLSLVLQQIGLMSPYYCLKTYYVLWLVSLIVFTDGIMQIFSLSPKTASLYLATITILVVSALFITGDPLVDVYEYNFSWLKFHDMIGNETIRGYRYATNEIIDKNEKITWLTDVSLYGRVFWFYSIQAVNTNDCDYCQAWNYDSQELKEILDKSKVQYIGIYKFAPNSYEDYQDIIEKGKLIFETTEIAIYRK